MVKYFAGPGGVGHQAILNAYLDDEGSEDADMRFQWGGTDSYGNDTPWVSGKGTGDTHECTIRGLGGNTTYHFRAQCKNAVGTAIGLDESFTTR